MPVIINYASKNRRLRLVWVKPHIQDHVRDIFAAYNALFMHFYFSDDDQFCRMARMTPLQFDKLHNIIGNRFVKTSLRRPLPFPVLDPVINL